MNSYSAAPVDKKLLIDKVEGVHTLYKNLMGAIETVPPKAVVDAAEGMIIRLEEFSKKITRENVDIDDAVNHAEGVAIHAGGVVLAWEKSPSLVEVGKNERDALRTAAVDLRQYAEAHVGAPPRDWVKQVGEVTEQSPLASDVDKRLAQLLATVEKTERQMLAMEARLKALGKTADSSVQRVEELTASQAQAARVELNKQVEDINGNFEAVSTEIRSKLDVFDRYELQATKMLSQLAATTLSGGYMGSAEKEEKAANNFRWASIAVMGVTVILLGGTLYQLTFDGLDWKPAVIRLAISLLMAVPTAYLARESGKHRAQAVNLRRTSLDFSVLEPFLEKVEGEAGAKLRAELAQRVFFMSGQGDLSSSYGLDPQAIIMKGMDTIADLSKQKR